MITTSFSGFRKHFKRYIDRVTRNFEILIVKRGSGDGVAIMSLSEYISLCSTAYELSSKENQKRLDSAIEKIRTGKSFEKTLIENG